MRWRPPWWRVSEDTREEHRRCSATSANRRPSVGLHREGGVRQRRRGRGPAGRPRLRPQGLALVADKAAPEGLVPADTYPFLADGLFVTLTNVNFDPEAIEALDPRHRRAPGCPAGRAGAEAARRRLQRAPVAFVPADTVDGLAEQGREHDLNTEASADANLRSLQHTIALRAQGRRRLCLPCRGARIPRPGGGRVLRRGLGGSRPLRRRRPQRLGRQGPPLRRDELQDHGAARQGQHRDLRHPGAHRGAAWA